MDSGTRIAGLEDRANASSAPPIQKFGDTWIAASALGTSEMIQEYPDSAEALRSSVQRMFESCPNEEEIPKPDLTLSESIQDWQPTTERDLSIFSRSSIRQSATKCEPTSLTTLYDQMDLVQGHTTSETILSFDPNDLNPSRSASQVRRPSTIVGPDDLFQKCWPRTPMSMVLEGGSDEGSNDLHIAPTYLSHVTFPKPKVGAMPMTIPGGLPMIPSVTSSSVETTDTATLRTPRTDRSSVTTASSVDSTVLAKLETHSTEHGTIAKQIDGVQIDIQSIIRSLGMLVQQAMTTPDSIPKALDQKITSLHLDFKGVENALQLSSLASSRQSQVEEPKLADVHNKLDNIAKLCEDLLAKQAVEGIPISKLSDGLPILTSRVRSDTCKSPASREPLELEVQPSEETIAGEEVAQIMADLVSPSPA